MEWESAAKAVDATQQKTGIQQNVLEALHNTHSTYMDYQQQRQSSANVDVVVGYAQKLKS